MTMTLNENKIEETEQKWCMKDKKKIFFVYIYIESLKKVAAENNMSMNSNRKTLKMKRYYFFVIFILKIKSMCYSLSRRIY